MKKIGVLFLIMFFGLCLFAQTIQSQEQPINSNVKEIIVIFKTHFDIGYTHRVKDLLQYYRTEMIDKALDIMDKTKDLPKEQQFAWTAPGWVMAKVLEDWPGQTPERRKRLEEAFKSGRFVSHAAPFTVESEIMFTKDFIPQKPIIYLNLYNNQWNTNYRYWYPGTWSSKVRIWTFTKDNTVESRLVTPSLEARTPLLIAEAEGKAGNLLTEQTGISLSRKGIQITAFRSNSPDNPIYASAIADEKSTLLRLWEQGGISGDITVTLPNGSAYTKAVPVSLRGEVIGVPITISSGKLGFYLHAYAPASFVLE